MSVRYSILIYWQKKQKKKSIISKNFDKEIKKSSYYKILYVKLIPSHK